jgi:SAM-dependent methyltransferase
MNINDLIENDLELKEGVHYLKRQRAFNYSDGDSIENYIFDAINNAKDISSNSRELEGKIKDWPTLYHLSREHSIAYNSLEFPPNSSILEVGCGCGSITRLLGERVAHVLALEGSPRRASITRARTRDLESVTVLCASFEDVVFSGVFDFIICNGVLEYAPYFVKHNHPTKEFIRLLASLLKSSGSLVVAIENKFGLRYFSSGKEDHTGIMFDGIEGYARFPKGPITFGFPELHVMLNEHFSNVETFLPLPDYKLPIALIRAELLEEVNCADLFAAVSRYDFETYKEPYMYERLVWHELQKNHMMKIFANSYFIIAGHREISLLRPDWMGDIYAIKRKVALSVRTTISKGKSGAIQTTKNYFESNSRTTDKSALSHVLNESQWVNGVSIHTIIVRAMLRSEANLPLEERFREPVIAWWKEILSFKLEDGTFKGDALDCVWQNAILNNGKVSFIDKEWISNSQLEPMSIIYRSVAVFADQENYYIHLWDRSCRNLNQLSLMHAVANLLGIKMKFRSVIKAMKCYLDIHESVHGNQSIGLKRFSKLFMMLTRLLVPFSLRRYIRKINRMRKAIIQIPNRLFHRVF